MTKDKAAACKSCRKILAEKRPSHKEGALSLFFWRKKGTAHGPEMSDFFPDQLLCNREFPGKAGNTKEFLGPPVDHPAVNGNFVRLQGFPTSFTAGQIRLSPASPGKPGSRGLVRWGQNNPA